MRTVVLSLLSIAFLACASQPVPTDDLAALEQELMRAFVRADRATLDRILADDYRCEVAGMTGAIQRWVACPTLGHHRTGGVPEFPEDQQSERATPYRSARIDGIQVARDGDRATVTATHSYHHWLPHDGNFVRVSHVTDTWERRGGRWLLVKRVSRPVQQEPVRTTSR